MNKHNTFLQTSHHSTAERPRPSFRRHTSRILAINPGTREMGVAILEEGDLLHYQVLSMRTQRPRRALMIATNRALDRLYDFFLVDRLVVETIPNPSHPLFELLVTQVQTIHRWAHRRSIPLTDLPAPTVRKHLVAGGRATKREVARMVVSRFPELRLLFTQDCHYKEIYWQTAFDAVALALTAEDLAMGRA